MLLTCWTLHTSLQATSMAQFWTRWNMTMSSLVGGWVGVGVCVCLGGGGGQGGS
jgi:hypothetical protein